MSVRARSMHGGYPYLTLKGPAGQNRKKFVHRLVCEAFHGPCPSSRHMTRHLNDDPLDNRACNLAWGTAADNQADRIKNNRMGLGQKLDPEEVAAIRWAHDRGCSVKGLAEQFAVTPTHIRGILRESTRTKDG